MAVISERNFLPNIFKTWLRTRLKAFLADWKKDEPFDWRGTLTIIVGTVLLLPLTRRLPMLSFEW